MKRKCKPGVFCIENITLVFLSILFFIISSLIYFHIVSSNKHNISSNKHNISHNKEIVYIQQDNNQFNNQYNPDVFSDPYVPPIKFNHFLNNSMQQKYFNLKTNNNNYNYKQIGILTRINGTETILPLFGKPLHTNRNKWQYYTMNDKNHMIKLPIVYQGKSCTNEYGCNELYNQDNVFVEGYNDSFKITIYDNY